MIPANKILTVAYGTFSCTLEGFDDPFSAMTDIAEYFRDLAEKDRFFGAEPPTPDMAMLRQIAEARANKQIEAESTDDGVTLRPAAESQAVAAAPAADVVDAHVDAAFTDDEDPIDALVETAFDDHDASAEPAPVEAQDDVAEDDEADSVAAKLARIRGVVDADRAIGVHYSEDEHVEEWNGFGGDTPTATFDEDEVIADETADDVIVEDDTPEIEAEDAPAALLDSIETGVEESAEMSLVAEPEVEAVEVAVQEDSDDTFDLTDEDAITAALEEGAAEDEIQIDAFAEAIAAAEAEAEAKAEAAIEEPVAEIEDTLEEEIAEAEVETEAAEEEIAAAIEETADEDINDEADEDDQPGRRVRRLRIRRRARAELAAAAEAAEQIPASTPDTDALAEVEGEAEVEVDLAEIEDDLVAELPDDDEAELMAELAAIAAEDDVAVESAEDDAITAQVEDDDDDLPDDLDALLAAAEADPVGDDEIDEMDEVEEDAAELEEIAEDEDDFDLTDEDEGEDTPDLERLFAATDSRLTGAETSRVHANISHLKAAVAARRADSSMTAPKADETDAYRVDLANTVRPRSTEDEADSPARPAPLVLVSAQRVEEEDEAAEAPTPTAAPRRALSRVITEDEISPEMVQAAEAATQDAAPVEQASTDFEAFAAEMGATDLTEILEAAAAYTARVLEEETFSRPRLLHLASEAGEEFSREDGLRGFGQLLRDGVIRKVKRGTFTLSEDSRFLAEAARRAG